MDWHEREVLDGLTLALVPTSIGIDSTAGRRLPLDAAPPTAVCRALFQFVSGARGAASAVSLAAASALCLVSAGAEQPDHGGESPGDHHQCADRTDRHHA